MKDYRKRILVVVNTRLICQGEKEETTEEFCRGWSLCFSFFMDKNPIVATVLQKMKRDNG